MENSSRKEIKKPNWMSKFDEIVEKRGRAKTPEEILTWYEKKLRTSIVDELETPVGQVLVVPDRCKECNYCWNFCPEDVLEMSEKVNIKGYHYPKVVEGKTCVLCGFCAEICPDFAIYTKDMKEVA